MGYELSQNGSGYRIGKIQIMQSLERVQRRRSAVHALQMPEVSQLGEKREEVRLPTPGIAIAAVHEQQRRFRKTRTPVDMGKARAGFQPNRTLIHGGRK